MLDLVFYAIAGAAAAFLLWAGTRDDVSSKPGWSWKSRAGTSGGSGHGVSPVVGTVIMVAITVILATVLYVMVTGLTGET